MKKQIPFYGIILHFLFVTSITYGQLTGTKTIPGNYSTISAAISALNSQGVGAGGVTFNVSAGFTETIAARLNLTATGTAANPIVFQKNGVGSNPKITAYTGGTATPASAIPNGIWSFQGSDYVTINGIDLYDPNTTNPANMEYGYGFFRNNAYDGAQYNTIRNCTVTLNRVNIQSGISPMVDGSVCILVINSTPTAATSAFAPFAPSGTNSYNHFYSNTLQNCNYGVVMTGSIAATPFDLGDNGNDVGGASVSTGNSILNFGGGTGNSVPAGGVRAINQWELNVSYNTINNNNGSGANPYYRIYGINAESGTSANANMNYNTLSVKGSTNGYESYGIYNGIGSTPASNTINLNHNTITNCSASGYFCGIYSTTSATTVNIDYNIFSGITSSGSSSLTAIYTTAAINTLVYPMNLNIGNNQISQFTKTGSVNSSTMTLINCGGQNLNCHDNLLEYITMTVSSTSSSIYGITVNSNTTTETISNNILKDFTINFASNGYIDGIYSDTNTNKTVQNNQLYNFTGTSQGGVTAITAKGLVSGNQIHDFTYASTANFTGIATTGTSTLNNNQIYGFSNTVGTSGAMRGINASTDSTVTISKNSITNLSSGNSNATVQGIYLGNGTKYVYNNYISDLKAPNSTSTLSISGIDVYSTGTVGIYDNSVYISANSTGATFGTAAISVNSTGTIDLRNNNFINTSIPNGGGYTVAHLRSGTSLTSYATISNNNNFYAGMPGLYRLIFYNGTNADQTLAAYKVRVAPRDAASITENPPFMSTTPGACNLHLSTIIPTQCESQGTRITTPVAVTADFDGDLRQGEPGYTGTGTAPDIGADEGEFTIADFSPPAISYPLLTNSCTTGDRTITATITDLIGVPLAGSLVPRIYFRKNSGSWYSQPGFFVSGTGKNGTWSFTIVAADMGGVISTDMVFYYLIAQDIYSTPNVGSNPIVGLVATNVNTVITPPATPNSYTILNFLSGTVQVGIGKTFATLTAAAAAYNSSSYCLSGNVVFELTDAIYSAAEVFPVVFNLNPFAGVNNTLTIRPANGVSVSVSGSSANAVIKFNGAKYITLDGSNSGGIDRSLTISNTSTGSNTAAIWVASTGTGNGSNFITIKNCNLSAGSNSATSYGIYAGSNTSIGIAGDDNDNLTIRNNSIYKAYSGISVDANTTGVTDNLVISGNLIGAPTSDNFISHDGIKITQATGAEISGNEIYNITMANTNPSGIIIGTGILSSTISRNSVHGIRYSGTSGNYGGRGIYVSTGNSSSNITIVNNLVYDLSGIGSPLLSFTTAGIMLDGITGGINLFYNSVYISGINTGSSMVYTTAMLFNSTGITAIDVRDNIFMNSQFNSNNSSSQAYAIYSVAPATAFSNINYNDYFGSGTQGLLGYLGGVKTTLAAWQAATGKDANSQNSDPLFVAVSDLRPGSGAPVIGGGISIPGITTDYSGAVRNANPSMGAYENGVDVRGPVISYTPLGNTDLIQGRVLTANITDVSGVPVSGIGLPVLYWKVNAGSWMPATGVAAGGNQYEFSFGTGVLGGDIVYYYVVAQDENNPVPNVSSFPLTGAGGFGYNPPGVSTPPSTPSSYRIINPMTGDLIIGAGGDYANLTGNAGLFKAINENVVIGDITAFISSDLVEEGTNALNQWTEQGGSNFTLTIMPYDKEDRLISGNVSISMININGADRVNITGQFFGTGNYLTFRNTSASGATFRIQNDANFNTIQYCMIEGANAGTSGVISLISTTGNHDILISNNILRDRSDAAGIPMIGIYASGSTISNYNITITGNQIFNYSYSGIFLNNGGNGNNWTITDNSFFNALPVPVAGYQSGIFFDPGPSSNGNVISGNFVGGRAANCGGGNWINSGANQIYGIYVNAGTLAGTSIQGNTIQSVSMTSTGNSSFYGIYSYAGNNNIGTITGNVIGSPSTPASISIAGIGNVYGIFSITAASTIKHNLISNISQTATNPGIFYGIYLGGNYTFNIEANAILNCGATSASTGIKDVTGIYYKGSVSGTPSCTLSNNLISLGNGVTNNNVYKGVDDFGYSGNNLFSWFNTIYIGGTSTGSSNSYGWLKRDVTNETHRNNIYFNSRTGGTGKHYAIANTSVASGSFSGNYNDLFSTGPVLAIWNTTNQADIVAWRTASGQDANSKSVNPGFVSTADLHPTNLDLNAAGTTIAGITTDFSGALRGNPPDIGAYEFNPPPKTWNGNISNDWNNPVNWTPNGVPTSGISVIIPSGTPNACVVNTSGMVCNDMILDGAIFTINPSIIMTIFGNVTMQNNAFLNDDGILTVHGDFIKN